MELILKQAASPIFLILLGYLLKRIGVFRHEDSHILMNVMLYVTLPAALLNAFRDFRLDRQLVFLIIIGLLVDAAAAFIGWAVSRGKDPRTRGLYMLCTAGFNVGSFAVPFLQVFVPHQILSMVVFDVGNSAMNCGGIYSVAALLLHPEEKPDLKALVKNLLCTWPFNLYLSLFLLGISPIQLPEAVYTVSDTIAAGNVMASMLALGVMLEPKLSSEGRRYVLEILALRAIISVVLVLTARYILPVLADLRQALALLFCSPAANMAVIFSTKLGCDEKICGTVVSLSILEGVVLLLGCLMIWPM